MANLAFDGFSIRGYTANMRSVDAKYGLPFNQDCYGELPPISVVKTSRWWAHELTRLRRRGSAPGSSSPEDTASAVLCPVCRHFSAATVNAVSAHLDDCLSAADRSASASDRRALAAILTAAAEGREAAAKPAAARANKSKPTKKRSIVEIFAVAPQIEQRDEEDCGEDVVDTVLAESFGELSVKKLGMIANKKKKTETNCVAISTKLKKKKKRKKKIKNQDHHNSMVAIKKKAQKFKRKNRANVAKKLNRFAKDILNYDSVCGKKTNGNCLSMQDKQNAAERESCRLISKNQEEQALLPIRSILKNHTSCEPTTVGANPCDVQSPERHVRFSEKDDILGPKRKDLCASEQNDGNVLLSDALRASPETVKSAENDTMIITEVNRSSEVDSSVSLVFGTEDQPVFRSENSADINPRMELPISPRLPITVQASTRVFPERNDMTIPPTTRGSFYDNNVHTLDESYPTTALEPGPFSISDVSRGNSQVHGSVSVTPNCIYTVAGMNSVENDTRRLSETVSFLPANENESYRLRFQSRHDEEIVNDHTLCCRPYCRSQPVDLISGFSSYPPEWKQKAVVLRRNTDDGFIGLPLTSHGELIQSSSRGKCMYTDIRETNVIGSSSGFFPTQSHTHPRGTGDYLGLTNNQFVEREFPNDRGNLFVANNYARENRSNFQLPARLGVTYWENNNERVDIHQPDFERRINPSFRPLEAVNLMNLSFDGSRPFGQVHTQKMNDTIHPNENSSKMSLNAGQPTMRLMGKDVPIGRSSKDVHGFDDGKVWTDKEMIIENCHSGGSSLHSSSLTRNFHEWIPQITSGNYEKVVPQYSLDVHSGITAQNHFLVKAPSPSFHRYLDWQTNDAPFQTSRNTSSNFLPFSHLPTSSTIFNGAPHIRDFFVTEAEQLQLRSQFPMMPTPHESFDHLRWRPAELSHRQNFHSPFADPDSRANHVQSPWFQNPNGLPSWLLHAKQQEKNSMISSQPQHISSRTNILNTPSVYHSAEGASCPYNLGPSHSQVNTSLGSAAISLPSHGPVIARVNQTSSVGKTGYRNRMKVKDRVQSKALRVKDPYSCRKLNKIVVGKTADLIDTTGSIIDLERNIDQPITMTPNSNSETQCDMVMDDFGGRGCYSPETLYSGMRSSRNECLRVVEGMGRSGPIKLSAGAKHILTPHQTMDDGDNFIPVHSTIPFVAETCVSTMPHQSQNKATKIYRF